MGLRPTNNEAAGPKIGRSPSVFSAFFTFSCFFPSVNATAGICELASGDSDSTIIFTIAPELSAAQKPPPISPPPIKNPGCTFPKTMTPTPRLKN